MAPMNHYHIKTLIRGWGWNKDGFHRSNAPTNFETDLFLPIINAVADLSGRVNYGDSKTTNISFKVIADHIRALSLRSAMGHFLQMKAVAMFYVVYYVVQSCMGKLGIDTAFLYKLVPIVGEIMESYYPEVLEQQEFIESDPQRGRTFP